MNVGAMDRKWERLGLALLLVVFAAVLVRTAWICDDAYMTFRTIDNFLHGYGLTWNIDERVQAYTHPLWMLVLLPLQLVTRDAFYTTAVFSIFVSLGAVALFAGRVAGGYRGWPFGVAALISSKAFVDYSTSGLENALTHLLIVLFLWQYFRWDSTAKRLRILALMASLAAVNRLDTLLIFLPGLAAAAYPHRWRRALGSVAIGFVPLVAWEAFSLIYYGFLFPNPAFAKLNTGIPLKDLVEQGLIYLANSLDGDPITLVVVGAGVAAAFLGGERRSRAIAAGVLLYLGYVVVIGGDFMSGRFLTAPLLASAAVLARALTRAPPGAAVAAAAVAAVLGLSAPYPTILSDSSYGADRETVIDENGIADERAYYFQTSGLVQHVRDRRLPYHRWYLDGLELRGEEPIVLERMSCGFFGYAVGPQAHVVDAFGLGDPLLARLPPDENPQWRIGHFFRSAPEGYIRSLASGINRIEDPDLAAYYGHLRVLIRRDVLDPARLLEIVRFNTGYYNDLLEAYLATR
jgi:arabinofuranosyltransferase